MDDSGLSILQVIIAQLGIQIGKGERIRKENFRIRVDRKDVGLIERICEQVAVFYLIGVSSLDAVTEEKLLKP